MKLHPLSAPSFLAASALIWPGLFSQAQETAQPAGAVPVLQEVDVVVVGGGSGGVAAAVEAAKKGAKVFLAAPRPYLGEDICATYRLWLEPGETPTTALAQEVFKPIPRQAPPAQGLPFRYTADVPSVRHLDSKPESLLMDGKWESASKESVQFDGDVSLTIDLGSGQEISRTHLLTYQRPGDFEVASIAISAGSEPGQWKEAGVFKNEQEGQGVFESALAISMSTPLKARYLKIDIKRAADATRLLLGEIIVEPASAPPVSQARDSGVRFTTPMQVKRTLDQALIEAKVPFLFWSYTTELLRDAQGQPAGVVIANRSGRQAVLAKVIIDATDRANVARLAGAAFTEYKTGTQAFSRVVVGGPVREGKGLLVPPRAVPLTIRDRKGTELPVHEYQLELQMSGHGARAFAEAEQAARDLTWTPEAVDGAEVLFQVPPDHLKGRKSLDGAWPGAASLPLECFQPEGNERLFVIGGCADISRQAAASLLRPVNLMEVGSRIGEAAAETAARLPGKLEGVAVAVKAPQQPLQGTALEVSAERNLRVGEQAVPEDIHTLPVLGSYDVVVVGGGTGGAPAAIAAGRQGARTLLLEYLHGLGGVGTLGFISNYYHGNRVGFTTEIDQGVAAYGDATRPGSWNPEHKSEWFRQELRKSGVDVWYGSLGTGAVVEDERVCGVVALTPQGRGVIHAKVVIDSTGNADIAAAAGAACRYTDETDFAVQGTGLPPRELGQKYTNTDYTFVDDTDAFDIWRVLVFSKLKFLNAYDVGQLIDTRERRQIVGDFTFSPMDMILRRTFPDTVVLAKSNFDSHGYIIHPMFMLRPPHKEDIEVRVPWRCLLPRGLDRIIVTGLGVSAHRDALPCIRMQPDIQNQGYAAGVAASMIAQKGGTTRDFDIKALQKHLIEIGNLPESVLTEADNFPLPREQVAEAVRRLGQNYEGLETVLAEFAMAQPLLREALTQATVPAEQLIYAHVLGMMGDAAGAAVLAGTVAAAPWDQGWRFKGMGQFGPCMSPLDSYIIALGKSKSPLALAPVLGKVSQLTPESEFSHFRAVAIALESLADPASARPLADLLRKPGLGGHAATGIEKALSDVPVKGTDETLRNKALTELYLARALYRCGDHEGLGEATLHQFSRDLHGHYARHARAILNEGAKAKANKP